MNKPSIQFLLCPYSLIRNSYNNSSSSHVGKGENEVEVGMDELLWQTSAMDAMLLHTFQDNEMRDDTHITEAFFESVKSNSNTLLFGPSWSKYTQLGTIMLLYNLKAMCGMSNACFTTLLR